MRKLALAFFTLALLSMPASALAQVYFDPPGSPANKEYGAPLERERSSGGVGGGTGGSGSGSGQGRAGGSGQSGGLFGEGISAQKSPEQAAREQRQRQQALKRKGEQRGADLAKKIRDEQAAAAGPNGGPPTPGPNAPASGAGSALPWTVGIVLAVLAASGLLALAMRRRGRASPG
jgi:hypothetical protein